MKLSIHELKQLQVDEIESNRRKQFCNSCEFQVIHHEPMCLKCACPIEFITTYDYQTCPVGVWQ